jgi:hypothetical protein
MVEETEDMTRAELIDKLVLLTGDGPMAEPVQLDCGTAGVFEVNDVWLVDNGETVNICVGEKI